MSMEPPRMTNAWSDHLQALWMIFHLDIATKRLKKSFGMMFKIPSKEHFAIPVPDITKMKFTLWEKSWLDNWSQNNQSLDMLSTSAGFGPSTVYGSTWITYIPANVKWLKFGKSASTFPSETQCWVPLQSGCELHFNSSTAGQQKSAIPTGRADA